jgi:hypothetical protein
MKKKSTITRQQVVTELASVKAKIAELEPKAVRPIAVTGNKHIEGVGCVQDMENLQQCVKAQAYMNNFTVDMERAAADLGLDAKSVVQPKYQGFSIDSWKSDIKNRVAYIQARESMVKLISAKAILEANLSEDDVFAMQMSKVSELLG